MLICFHCDSFVYFSFIRCGTKTMMVNGRFLRAGKLTVVLCGSWLGLILNLDRCWRLVPLIELQRFGKKLVIFEWIVFVCGFIGCLMSSWWNSRPRWKRNKTLGAQNQFSGLEDISDWCEVWTKSSGVAAGYMFSRWLCENLWSTGCNEPQSVDVAAWNSV